MESIKIIATSKYLPNNKVDNSFFDSKFNLDNDWITKRTGVINRFFTEDETIVDLAINVAKKITEKIDFDIQKIGNIIVASTSSDRIMPGISFEIQKALDIKKCMCLDISAGCSGFINAFDIARKNIVLEETEYALVIGVENISKFLDFEDVNTSILLGDGAGAVLLGKSNIIKKYVSNIESIGQDGDILTCHNGEKLYMNGKAIYKYAVSKVTENVENILEKSDEKIENLKYIIPHQSNIRILESMSKKLNINDDKMYSNLDKVGNTFCASIPIALNDIFDSLKDGDKLILVRIWWWIKFRKYTFRSIVLS